MRKERKKREMKGLFEKRKVGKNLDGVCVRQRKVGRKEGFGKRRLLLGSYLGGGLGKGARRKSRE